MDRRAIARVRLVAPSYRGAVPGLGQLVMEHPTVEVMRGERPRVNDAIIDVDAWSAGLDFRPFDDAVARSSSDGISVRGAATAVAPAALEVLTRWQRHVHRRNEASSIPLFDAVLRAHKRVHDATRPPAKADLDHAIDRWQWLLRLAPQAQLTAQLAALFHDVERAREVLVGVGVDSFTADRVRELVTSQEGRGRDSEVDLLDDADALSFLSLGSAGYADHFGAEQTRKKIAHTLDRLSPTARGRLANVRLRTDVAAHVRAVEGSA